jgi:hypothetical protein
MLRARIGIVNRDLTEKVGEVGDDGEVVEVTKKNFTIEAQFSTLVSTLLHFLHVVHSLSVVFFSDLSNLSDLSSSA